MHEFTDLASTMATFIPLMAMYPAADVPVVQLSMPSLDPARCSTWAHAYGPCARKASCCSAPDS